MSSYIIACKPIKTQELQYTMATVVLIIGIMIQLRFVEGGVKVRSIEDLGYLWCSFAEFFKGFAVCGKFWLIGCGVAVFISFSVRFWGYHTLFVEYR